MAEQRLYYGGHQYGYYAYGAVGIPVHEGAIAILGKATLTVDGTASSFLDSLKIVGRAYVLARGVKEAYGNISIVGKAQLTSTISYIGVRPIVEIIHLNEEVLVITIGGKRAEISVTDIKDDRIKPVVAVSQSKPTVSVATRTTKATPLHRGAEISYQIERSEEHIYAD